MARYEVKMVVSKKRIREQTVKRIAGAGATAMREALLGPVVEPGQGPGAGGTVAIAAVSLIKPRVSRRDRLQEGLANLEEGLSVVEELRDEMREWEENLPDGLRDSDRGERIREAADALDETFSELESAVAELGSIEFPGMYD